MKILPDNDWWQITPAPRFPSDTQITNSLFFDGTNIMDYIHENANKNSKIVEVLFLVLKGSWGGGVFVHQSSAGQWTNHEISI